MRWDRLVAVLGIAVGLVGLAVDYWVIASSGGVPAGGEPRSAAGLFVYFWSFFTHVTNMLLVLVYVGHLTRWTWLSWLSGPVGRASMAGNIALVMVFFHFMLAPLYTFTGGLLVANYLLHYVAPIIYLFWWVFLTRHGELRFSQIPAMLVIGLVYLAFALVRGTLINEYPYEIIDLSKQGYGGVAAGVGVLLAAVAAFCAILVLLDKVLGRRQTPAGAPAQ